MFLIEKNTFDKKFDLKDYGIDLINQNTTIVVDNLNWKGKAKKSGIEIGDIISEFKIENSNRPDKKIIYPIALIFLIIFGYLNKKE